MKEYRWQIDETLCFLLMTLPSSGGDDGTGSDGAEE